VVAVVVVVVVAVAVAVVVVAVVVDEQMFSQTKFSSWEFFRIVSISFSFRVGNSISTVLLR